MVGIALIVSWFVAVIFAPLIGMAVLKAPKEQGEAAAEIMRAYRGFLVGAMRARWLTILVTIGLFAAALFAIRFVPQQFFPASDRPELVVDLTLPKRLDLCQRDRAERLDGVLEGDEDVARWSTYVGRGAIRFYLPLDVQLPNDFFTQAVIVAKDVDARDRLQRSWTSCWRKNSRKRSPRTPRSSWGRRSAGRCSIASAAEMDQVREIALGRRDGRDQPRHAQHQLRLERAGPPGARPRRPGRGAPARPELGALAGVLNAAVTGSTVTQVRDDIYLIDVVARAIGEERISLPTLRTLQVPLPNGRTVALNQFATFEYAQEYPWSGGATGCRRSRCAPTSPGRPARECGHRACASHRRGSAGLPQGYQIALGGMPRRARTRARRYLRSCRRCCSSCSLS